MLVGISAVYWHERIRSVIAMFHRFIDGAVGSDVNSISRLAEKMKSCNTEYECVQKVFVPLLSTLKSEATPERGSRDELEPLIRMHFKPNSSDIYRTYGRFTFFDRVKLKSQFNNSVYDTIVRTPEMREMTGEPIDWSAVKRLRNCYMEAFRGHDVNVGRFDIIVDVPWGKASSRNVSVLDMDGGKTLPITKISHLSETIFSRPTAFSAPIRVFVKPSLYFKCSDNSIKERITKDAISRFFSGENVD